MLRIVTDSSVDMPEDWKNEYEISVIPVNINFGSQSFRQGIDIGYQDFYRLVNELRIIPKTSLPSVAQFQDFYREIADSGDTVLSIHLGSRLSGTFATAQMAAKELAGELRVIPFDSGAGSAVMGFMCREARLLDRAGSSIEKILTRIENIRQRVTVVFTVDRLEFAHMSGRVNSLQVLLSSMLQIKPIIILRDGLLDIGEKVRTRHRALDRILALVCQRMGSRQVNLAVMHAADPQTGQTLHQRARQLLSCKDTFLVDLTISVAAHLGPGTVGIVAYPVEEV